MTTIDSYKVFMKHFEIEEEKFIDFGIEQTKFPEEKEVSIFWKSLKNNINTRGGDVFLRKYGGQGKGNWLVKKFYKELFGICIQIDRTNNYEPNKILRKTSSFTNRQNESKIFLKNYQVSHVFGRTKNPYLFLAPWNLVWKPKIFDPLTGHETKGTLSDEYQLRLQDTVKKKFKKYIEDYNNIVDEHFREDKVNEIITKIELDKEYDKKEKEAIVRFRKDIILEVAKI